MSVSGQNQENSCDTVPPVAEDTVKWYYERNGMKNGPVNSPRIADLISMNEIGYGTRVWREGFTDWQEIENTSLKSLLKTPPPLTGAAVSNKVIWFLAFAPIISLFIENFIWGMLHGSDAIYRDQLWFINLILNIALGVYDEKLLTRAGHDTKRMGAAWIVPVYLYKRAHILKHNLAYFIVWLVCFAIVIFS